MGKRTNTQRVVDAFSNTNEKPMEVLKELDDEELRDVKSALTGINNSIDTLLD